MHGKRGALGRTGLPRAGLVSGIVFGSLGRLFGKGGARRPAVAAAAAAPANPTAVRGVVLRAPAPAPAGVGARRPLISARGTLAGFEFHAAALDPRRMRRADDIAVAAAYTGNVLGAMRLCTTQKFQAVAELPAAWLMRCERDDAFGPGMHLLLRADAGAGGEDVDAIALTQRLRTLGVRVGWDPQASGPLSSDGAGRPDFMPLRAPDPGDAASWRVAMRQATQHWPGVPLVLLDLPGVDVLEALLGPQVLLAACAVERCAMPSKIQALPPQARRLLRLLDRLLHDDDNAGVVEDIKSDAALALRLLHYLNSAGAIAGRELHSVEQAVLMLGRDQLYRWIAQMLVHMAPPRPAAEALQSLALARARMLELLARAEGASSPGGLYLLGLASMLPLLLQCSVAEAADALHLSEPALQALQRHDGPWALHLELLQALEANDIAKATPLAAPFGGTDAVLALWAEAWRPR